MLAKHTGTECFASKAETEKTLLQNLSWAQSSNVLKKASSGTQCQHMLLLYRKTHYVLRKIWVTPHHPEMHLSWASSGCSCLRMGCSQAHHHQDPRIAAASGKSHINHLTLDFSGILLAISKNFSGMYLYLSTHLTRG